MIADYRLIMSLPVQGYAHRQVEVMAGCSHRAIARARGMLAAEQLTPPASNAPCDPEATELHLSHKHPWASDPSLSPHFSIRVWPPTPRRD